MLAARGPGGGGGRAGGLKAPEPGLALGQSHAPSPARPPPQPCNHVGSQGCLLLLLEAGAAAAGARAAQQAFNLGPPAATLPQPRAAKGAGAAAAAVAALRSGLGRCNVLHRGGAVLSARRSLRGGHLRGQHGLEAEQGRRETQAERQAGSRKMGCHVM